MCPLQGRKGATEMAGTQRRPIVAHPVDAVVKELLGITPEKTVDREERSLLAGSARKGGTTRRKVIPADPVILAVEAAESQGQDGYLAGIMAKTEAPEKTLEELTDIVTDAIGADILESRKLGPAGEDYLIRKGWTPEMVEEMRKKVDAGGPFENPLPIGEAIPDDPNLDSTDEAHPAWWRGQDHFNKVFEQTFGGTWYEVLEAWRVLHQPGVLLGLKLAVDLTRNPPHVEVHGQDAFKELRDELRTQMLSAVDDIAEKVGKELLGSDEVEELVITDEDIPELQEKVEEAKEAAIKVCKTEVAELRNALSATIDTAADEFKDDVAIADMGSEGPAFDGLGVIHEASQAILYLRKHHGELG